MQGQRLDGYTVTSCRPTGSESDANGHLVSQCDANGHLVGMNIDAFKITQIYAIIYLVLIQ